MMLKFEKKMINNVEEMKDILNVAAKPHFVQSGLNTLEARLCDHIYGDIELTEVEQKALNRMFPMEIQYAQPGDMELPIDYEWCVGTSSTPAVIDIGQLIMHKGSSITAKNTVLIMTVNTLIRESTPPKPGEVARNTFDIGILGVPGETGKTGDGGIQGGGGQKGENGKVSSPGIAGEDGKPGGPGDKGGNGKDGEPGNPGKPSLLSNISITKELKGHLVLFTQSGAGGTGGIGGVGGKGGKGGSGGDGITTGCEGNNGGHGGTGGKGGIGGTGGIGGAGVNGNDVYVYIPRGSKKDVSILTQEASAGEGGIGGRGGDGGDAGDGGGKGSKHSEGGARGQTGAGGDPGMTGKVGTHVGIPGRIFVTEK